MKRGNKITSNGISYIFSLSCLNSVNLAQIPAIACAIRETFAMAQGERVIGT